MGFLLSIAAGYGQAETAFAATVVLDPGHGGNNEGAGSGSAFSEKRFTLALAQAVAAALSSKHRVELTRSADIELAPADRAAVANHLKADLMVSLHAAVAPYCSDRTAAVYIHNDERLVMGSGKTESSKSDPPAWETLQIRHQQNSQTVAEEIRIALEASGAFDHVAVYTAPLIALMGADLPAVLLEVGCIHPTVALTKDQYEQQLNAYAGPIAAAIETALDTLAP
ncbi:N-acetylmuramoyl-L-alanine amidase [uncultured Desulfosarcina sp.]|uniref:N-acetylmuramoyl-L-alanine amidase n=1 Tax=uncultured Desulfosarcina sp. TaxID=218289 RepID=UPI0029C8B68A|nr:N-acetylmuramoyl-L-alanine amidase [uncultured Desulfosarcina sp.]